MHKFGSSASSPRSEQLKLTPDYFCSLGSAMEMRQRHPNEVAESQEQEDDFVAGLVEQMAHSMLDDGEDEKLAAMDDALNGEDWSRGKWIPVQGIPAAIPERSRTSGWSSANSSPSPGVSPPTPLHHVPYDSQNDAWELLHMAAQEVMRLKMGSMPVSQHPRDEMRAYRQGAQRDLPLLYNEMPACRGKSPCPSTFAQHDWKPRSGVYKHSSCYQYQASNQAVPPSWNRRTRAVQQPQNHQLREGMNNRSCYPPGSSAHRSGMQAGPLASSPHWPSNPNPTVNNGSGMRALFLREPGFGGTSAGTGVFLPQATGSSREQKRKPSCSTVLLPSRIVEVLNLNVDDLHCQAHAQQPGHTAVQALVAEPEDDYLSAHLSNSYSACSPTRWHHSAAEHALPTEWTY